MHGASGPDVKVPTQHARDLCLSPVGVQFFSAHLLSLHRCHRIYKIFIFSIYSKKSDGKEKKTKPGGTKQKDADKKQLTKRSRERLNGEK